MATKRATVRQALTVAEWYNEIDAQFNSIMGIPNVDTLIPLDLEDGRTLLFVTDGNALSIAHSWNDYHEQLTKPIVWLEDVNATTLAVWQERD